jgi:hypothetical protein
MFRSFGGGVGERIRLNLRRRRIASLHSSKRRLVQTDSSSLRGIEGGKEGRKEGNRGERHPTIVL